MNTAVPFSPSSGFWRRTCAVLAVGTLGLGTVSSVQAQVVFGLSGTDLTSVNLASPATSQTRVAITGVAPGQALVGLDFRPATGQLYALGYNADSTRARLYVIDQTTAVATPVGAAMTLNLGSAAERIGFDFNPTVDRIRVVSTNDANYRLHPVTGAVTTDGTLAFAAGDSNAGQNPYVGAAAYTNSYIGAATTTLYTIDEQRSQLLIQNPPNAGTQNTVLTLAPTALGNPTPINAPGASTDLDIVAFGPNDQQFYLNVNQVQGGQFVSLLYRVDPANGNTTLAGAINGTGVGITDIAIRINRTAPAPSGQLLYAVNTNNNLLSFYSGTPQYINSAVPLSGVTAGQTIVGTDFRPNTGQLMALGYDAATAGANSQLYVINPASGAATAVAPAIRLELGGASDNIGFDFNPTVDRIRVVSTNGANYRLNPVTGGLAATDGTLAYAAADPNAGQTPRIGAVGYTNSYPGSTSTVLFDIDEALSILAIQNPPNAGTLNTVGNPTGLALNPANALVDLDIYYDRGSSVNRAFLTANPNGQNTSNLYTLDLTSGAPTLAGAIGLGIPVRDVAAQLMGANDSLALVGRLLYGVAGGNLVSFDSGNPGVIRSAVNITGLPATQVLVGADFRPATGQLLALGYNATTQEGQLYSLNLTSGALTAIGALQTLNLGTTANAIGFDFNPTVDRIRITSAANQANLRMNPADGAFLVDGTLSNPGGTPTISGAAYTNNDNNANTGTTLYGYDQARQVLLRSTNANAGTYVDQGPSGITVNPGVDFDVYSDLTDPDAPANAAFLVASPTGSAADNLYSVNLSTGGASLLGRIGAGSNLTSVAAFLTPGPVITGALTWTGAVSTDWGTAGNWSPAQVPGANDDVIIPNVANDPVVSGAQQARNLTLGSGATLTTNDGGVLTLAGNFQNNGGSTSGAGTGEVRFTGPAAQTIAGSMTMFHNLTAGPAGVVASGPVQVQRVLTLNGNLASNGNLTLLSNAAGTAHVINNGAAVVQGTATVQRYISPALNPGPGYRHYSAPVSGSTVADLATPGYTPVVNPAYNTSPTPTLVTPFPTVFGYDEQRVNTSGNPVPQDFDKGFFSPGSLGDALVVGRGYTVNIPASQTVDFVGTLNNGPIAVSGLTRGPQAESGWHLLGNPYPSPINWDLVSRSSVDAAVYVYRATGPYAGTYSTYVANGVGTNGGTNVIGTGQGFFVRASVSAAAVVRAVSFDNDDRLTTYASPVFQRGAATAPLVRLELRAATGAADDAVVYFEPGATAGFDAALDAYKLLAGNGPALASEMSPAALLSVNALPALAAADVTVPLRVQAQPGSYTLQATELLRLPAGRFAYLRDALTGAVVDLAQQPAYTFAVAAGAPVSGRFSLLVSSRQVLATAPASLSQQVAVFPNPARTQVTLGLPAALRQQPVAVSLVNSLGQVVRRHELPAARTADAPALSLSGVAPGVYTLRLSTAQGMVNKRLVVE
ncbi:DUF4394 domain-containing protein [Hymenobacter sp. B81]|uniref:DUF4394 domain-containing protein n=1 Tax=Hymenobacter sp. B81 TaxID=3344878 RepID=UPI0037DDC819